MITPGFTEGRSMERMRKETDVGVNKKRKNHKVFRAFEGYMVLEDENGK